MKSHGPNFLSTPQILLSNKPNQCLMALAISRRSFMAGSTASVAFGAIAQLMGSASPARALTSADHSSLLEPDLSPDRNDLGSVEIAAGTMMGVPVLLQGGTLVGLGAKLGTKQSVRCKVRFAIYSATAQGLPDKLLAQTDGVDIIGYQDPALEGEFPATIGRVPKCAIPEGTYWLQDPSTPDTPAFTQAGVMPVEIDEGFYWLMMLVDSKVRLMRSTSIAHSGFAREGFGFRIFDTVLISGLEEFSIDSPQANLVAYLVK